MKAKYETKAGPKWDPCKALFLQVISQVRRKAITFCFPLDDTLLELCVVKGEKRKRIYKIKINKCSITLS